MKLVIDAAQFESPIGRIELYGSGDELVGLEFKDRFERMVRMQGHLESYYEEVEVRGRRDPAGAVSRLRRYFRGELGVLEEQPVRMHGTEFQVAVWNQLRRIRPGDTISYGTLAKRVGRPNAMRAVGAANGANPVALFVPCHRVIAANGTLWGYGGGLDRKRFLLEHEGALGPALL